MRRTTPLGEKKYSLHVYHVCARLAHLEKKIIRGKWRKKIFTAQNYARLAHLVEKKLSTKCLAHLGTIRK